MDEMRYARFVSQKMEISRQKKALRAENQVDRFMDDVIDAFGGWLLSSQAISSVFHLFHSMQLPRLLAADTYSMTAIKTSFGKLGLKEYRDI